MASAKERFIGLEWLRFFLGFYIVIFHTLHNYPEVRSWSGYVTGIGFFATSSFFILSGFLLAHVYLDDRFDMREPASSFMKKRFANLYPIHIGSMILAMSIATLVGYLALTAQDAGASLRFVLYDVNNDTGALNPDVLRHTMDDPELWFNVALNVFMLHAWNPWYLTFNPPSWSLSALFFFYLLFPFIAPRLMRIRRTRTAMALNNLIYLLPPLLVIATTDYGMPETGILHRNPLIRLPEFIAGILLCSFYYQRRNAGQLLRWRGLLALALYVALNCVVASWLIRRGHTWYYLLHNGLLMSAQLALLYIFVHMPMHRSARLARFAGRLGGASLPMFALHVPIYTIFSRSEQILAGEPSLCVDSLRLCLAAAGERSIWLYPLYLVLTVMFCILFQEQFVVRLRRLILRWLLPASADRSGHARRIQKAARERRE
ncbi:acyltransferase family protein [Kushneria aurantia]|uniref:Acyltransferase family protein n=1 Tax=Kushneria aurantia TaxID=504092 RepID=A0ABV6G4R0_9GAMM|nr:acyltransferase [Kushneria aurantia]